MYWLHLITFFGFGLLLNVPMFFQVRELSHIFDVVNNHAKVHTSGHSTEGYECTMEMFQKDQYAHMACQAENALQRNWYPSPIGGLFSYQAWNGFDGFWQNGIILETMLNFMHYSNSTRYSTVVTGALRDLYTLLEAYYPQPSYDDMAWYGISYARTYEVLGGETFLATARKIYDWNWENGWDETVCGGGMWFDQGMSLKATITNVQMFQLGGKLYLLSGSTDKQLLSQVNRTWKWILKSNIIDAESYAVYDSVALDTCKAGATVPWTYNSGVLIGGLVAWSKITGNQAPLHTAAKLANSTIGHLSQDGILTEQCDPSHTCNDDQMVFKGIFARNLRYMVDAGSPTSGAYYLQWLQHNANVLLQNDTCWENCAINYQDGKPYYNATTPVFDVDWRGPFNWTSPKQQVSALDLLVSAIAPGTRCVGDGCHFDPPTPPTKPLTCKNDPCPAHEQCCEYEGGYRTCCEPSQRCIDGYCE